MKYTHRLLFQKVLEFKQILNHQLSNDRILI